MDGSPTFPADFLWGAATSSYQIEGAVELDGRGRSIWDTFSHTPGRVRDGDNGDVAVDHYRRVEQDVALMRELGLRAYRFSIAWPRIVPDGDGAVEPRGLDFYRRLVELLRSADIEPVVTLYHWDLPQALQDRGGWTNRATVEAFVRYAQVVHDALGDRVRIWTTLNEPWCSSFLGYGSGEHAPGITDPRAAFRAAHHLLLAHGEATDRMRTSAGAEHDFGIVLNLFEVRPVSDAPADLDAARRIDGVQNRLWLDSILLGRYPDDVRRVFERVGADDAILAGDEERIGQPLDLLGVNFYQPHDVGAGDRARSFASPYPGADDVLFATPDGPVTDMGWGIDADALERTLLHLHRAYPPIPIAICENGAAFRDEPDADGQVDDQDRISFIDAHVAAVGRAIEAGVDVRGYFVWSLLDNFEWGHGYAYRFGLVRVDLASQRRTIKASGYWYRELLAQHGRSR